jgi:hypothetical protein
MIQEWAVINGEKDDNNMNMIDEVRECEKVVYGHASLP